MKVVFLDSAQDDLLEIYQYVAEHDVDAADHLIDRLHLATQRLARYPNSAPESDWYGPGVRKLSVGGYAIYYRVTATQVSIGRVIHGRRDLHDLET